MLRRLHDYAINWTSKVTYDDREHQRRFRRAAIEAADESPHLDRVLEIESESETSRGRQGNIELLMRWK